MADSVNGWEWTNRLMADWLADMADVVDSVLDSNNFDQSDR